MPSTHSTIHSMIAPTKDLLGVGLYTPQEAAMYARVSSQLMSRWVYGTKSGQAVINPQVGAVDDMRIVTFLDLVQALAIRRIRIERHISLDKIREAYIRAKETFNVQYPFALNSTRIGLFGPPNRQDIYICIGDDDEFQEGARKYFQLTGKHHGNQLIGEVVLTYHSNLTFSDDGLAAKYTPYTSIEGASIEMDPTMRFGEPFIPSCGYTARTLYEGYMTEGSIGKVVELYEADERDVRLAIDYFDDYLGQPVLRDKHTQVPA